MGTNCNNHNFYNSDIVQGDICNIITLKKQGRGKSVKSDKKKLNYTLREAIQKNTKEGKLYLSPLTPLPLIKLENIYIVNNGKFSYPPTY